jgi:drug/metabolite transporter (DMT)-like permease
MIGVGLVSGAASIGGFTVVFTRYVLPETDAFTLAHIRYGLAALCLIALSLWQGKKFRIDRRDAPALALLAVMFYGAFPYLFARSLVDTTAARGALVYATMPLVTMTLGALFRVEQLTRWKAMAVVFAVSGVWIAVGVGNPVHAPNALRGDIIMFIATSLSASYLVFAPRYVAKYDGLAMTGWSMLLGAMALAPVAMLFGDPFGGSLDISPTGWLVVVGLALPGGALMLLMFIKGLAYASPIQASVAVGFNPMVAILLAAAVLGEDVTWQNLVGFALIILAIICANQRSVEAD